MNHFSSYSFKGMDVVYSGAAFTLVDVSKEPWRDGKIEFMLRKNNDHNTIIEVAPEHIGYGFFKCKLCRNKNTFSHDQMMAHLFIHRGYQSNLQRDATEVNALLELKQKAQVIFDEFNEELKG